MLFEDSEGFDNASSRADAVLHPERLRIMIALSPNLRLTAPQINDALPDLARSSLYRHLSILVSAEAVRVIEVAPARGGIERLYALPEQEIVLEGEDLARARPEDLVRYFTNFVGSLMGHGRSFFGQADPNSRRGGQYSADALYLTDDEYEHLGEVLEGLTTLLKSNQPEPGRRRRMLYTAILPLED